MIDARLIADHARNQNQSGKGGQSKLGPNPDFQFYQPLNCWAGNQLLGKIL
jgi:hypothetical protein